MAGKLSLPYPSLLVLAGLALGFLPQTPEIRLDPDLAFALFLPPILFEASFYTSWRDFHANARAIWSLAVGLVAVSTWVVAVIADRLIPEMPMGTAVVLGAIVSPPDAAAATAVLERLRLPRRIVTIVQGESLVNDAVALVIYNFAVAAVVTGQFAWHDAAITFAITAVGSTGLGLALGWLWGRLASNISDRSISIAASFLVAFGTYLAADWLDLSGVIAVVAAGMVFSKRAPTALEPDIRLSAAAVWSLAIFVLNALAFVLIGLQLPQILHDLGGYSPRTLAGDAAVIAAAVILVRLVWVVGAWQVLRQFGDGPARRHLPGWREALVIGWSGMRGLVSLAAALALPDTIDNGGPFPARALVLFLSFAVILATLVVQGLTLGVLVRVLKLREDGETEREERQARVEAANAAIAVIDKLAETPALPQSILDRLRLLYTTRIEGLARDRGGDNDFATNADFADAARLAAISAERETVLRLRRERKLGDEALRRIERDLDLMELSVKRRRPNYSRATWLDISQRAEQRRVSRAAAP